MSKVRIGVIGTGGMGTAHVRYLHNGDVPNAVLAAVCDQSEDRLEWVKNNFGENVALFSDVDQMMDSGQIDAVIVATPHFSHPTLAIKALEKDLHVLVEKPAGVYTKQVREMNEAAAKSDKKFSIMFNERTIPTFQKIRNLIRDGQLGELKRINWMITTHYRQQRYYDMGAWRGTWAGEGGGVLINQCPHQIDLLQWFVGVPKRIRAFCSFGKYHDIEVEDDVTAYMEYEDGLTGVFITSTGEIPGTDRLEIVGNQGKLVLENDELTFWRLETSERLYNIGENNGYGRPQIWKCDLPSNMEGTEHKGITANWVDAILNDKPLLSPGEEGMNSLQMSNAMHLSSWLDDWAEIPVDEEVYLEKLEQLKNESKSSKS